MKSLSLPGSCITGGKLHHHVFGCFPLALSAAVLAGSNVGEGLSGLGFFSDWAKGIQLKSISDSSVKKW